MSQDGWSADGAAQPGAHTSVSRDALDVWANGHGHDFLNQYKSPVTVKYYADINPEDPAPAGVDDLTARVLTALETPMAASFAPATTYEDLVAAAVKRIKKAKTSKARIYEALYRVVVTCHREDRALTGAGVALAPAGAKGKSLRRTHTPLPLRDSSVSRCALDRKCKLGAVPDFAMPTLGTVPQLPTAVVGVLDDTINFTHTRFQADWGTRAEFAWIQDAKALDPVGGGGKGACDDRVAFGREHYRTEIDAEIAKAPDDPDALLRAFGQAPTENPDRPVGYLHASHGTHVADVATGYAPDEADHHSIRLMSVQLPELAYFDNSGMAMSFFILEGAKFVLWRAVFLQILTNIEEALAGVPAAEWTRLPVVLNISYGLTGGPHSGGHYLEEGLDALITFFTEGSFLLPNLGPVDVVIPAGNDFLQRRFATARRGDPALDLTMRIPAKDKTANFLEVWVPEGQGVVAEVQASTQAAPTSIALTPGAGWVFQDQGHVVARLSLDQPFDQEPRLWRVLLAIAPTDTQDTLSGSFRRPAQAGRWRLKVAAPVGPNDVIEAYIHTEDPNIGFPRSDRPCYFDMPGFEARIEDYGDWNLRDTGPSVVRRFGTLNGFGNGRLSTVVGAYRIRTREASLYSSAGRTLAQSYYGRTPTLMAAADLSRVNPGLMAASQRPGGSYIQTGTSVAAPLVARAIAEAAQSGETVQDVVERASDFEATINYQPPITAQQKGDGRLPLGDANGALSDARAMQWMRGLYGP